jgi:hypothetical protein
LQSAGEQFMKKFLAIYMGGASSFEKSGWNNLNEQERKQRERAGIEGWQKWVQENEASIVDLGTPLGKTKRISVQGIADTKNELAAYTIVQAESHEAAAKIFENHPHFTIFPGDSVEIMECLPLPEM